MSALFLTTGIGVILVVVFLVRKYYGRNKNFWSSRRVFEVDVNAIDPVWKRYTQIVPFVEFDKKLYKAVGDEKYAGFIEIGEPVLYIKDLELLKRVLVKDFEYFEERRRLELDESDKIFTKMLTNLVGKEWKDLRSAMSPAFTTSKIRRMFEFFNNCGKQMATYLKESGNTEMDFQDIFGRYTLGAIASIAFNADAETFKEEDSVFRKMVKKMQTFGVIRFAKMLAHILIPGVAKALKLRISDPESANYFSSVLERAIRERRERGERRNDFLQLMLDAQAGQLKMDEKDVLDAYEKDALLPTAEGQGEVKVREKKVEIDDLMILSQSLLFFFAGADTLESLLTFAAYELALNPDVQDKLAEAVAPSMKENDGNIDYDAVQNIQYLDMVVSETLRMHPPAFATERFCTREYRIPETDIVIPKGTRILVPINGIQHDKRYYPEPEKFDPENFSPENKATRHPYTWLPFGQGPRNCIAMRFALIEAKAAIAHLVYNFKVEPCARTPIPVKVSKKTSIKKPENGMWLKFTSRTPDETNGFVKL